MTQTPLDFALSYIEKGWEVIPLNWITDSGCSCGCADCSSPGKHPYARLAPSGLKDATTNPQMLRDWWGVVPKLNVGIATGEASGLVVLDIDPKNGGEEGAKQLAERYGSFAGTATVSTGSGGRHYYFRHPGFAVRNTAGSLAKGVDTRGDGGYVVAPPSNHVSGVYEWESEELMPMPAWISPSERPSMSGARRVLGEMIPKGVQHTRLVSIAGSMRRRGLTADEIGPSLIVVSKRCEEVPPEDHVWRIARSVEKYPPGDAGCVDWKGTPKDPEQGRPNILVVKSLNEWLDDASAQTVPLRLYGDLWFQYEVCVMFAETNVGKSILAVQIAQALASGNSTLFGFDVEAPPGKVLYIDFELSAQQFYGRYSDEQGRPFRFHPDLTRAVVDVDFDFDEGWAEAIDRSIEDLIKEHEPLYVIVDNITFLKDEQEKAKGAVPLMRRLKSLQRRYGISLLALAHTPKRDQSRPLNKSDLGGSRHILNFVDSCFALGESHRDIGTRYVKQMKVRPVEFTLDTGNVAFLSLEKTRGFLGFNFEGFGPETEHLRARSSAENTELSTEILTLKASDPHISNREIGRRLGTSHVQVGRVINKEKEREAEQAAKGGTSVPLNGQGGTGGTDVPVFHPSKQNGNGTLPKSGTGGTSVPGVPPHRNGAHETPGDDGESMDGPAFVWDEDDGGGDPE